MKKLVFILILFTVLIVFSGCEKYIDPSNVPSDVDYYNRRGSILNTVTLIKADIPCDYYKWNNCIPERWGGNYCCSLVERRSYRIKKDTLELFYSNVKQIPKYSLANKFNNWVPKIKE